MYWLFANATVAHVYWLYASAISQSVSLVARSAGAVSICLTLKAQQAFPVIHHKSKYSLIVSKVLFDIFHETLEDVLCRVSFE